MTYEEWEATVPTEVRADAIWTLRVYRSALYASALAEADARKLASDPILSAVAPQLVRAVTSIGANIGEGYSRSSKRERVLFYEYALGSARESRDWYLRTRDGLGTEVDARLAALASLSRIVLTLIKHAREKPKR
jgi:four helix bundle protein